MPLFKRINEIPRPHYQKQNKRCRINHHRKPISVQRSITTSSSCSSCRTLENNRIPTSRNQPNQIRKRH